METAELERLKGKNWVAALVLCWFLGPYGAHRFYTGKSNTAWVMFVLTILGFTAPVAMIWTLVDGFTIALGRFTHEDGSELYERIDWLGYIYIAMMILGILAVVGYFLFFIMVMGAAISSMPSTF